MKNRSLMVWAFLAVLSVMLFMGVGLTGQSILGLQENMLDCTMSARIDFTELNSIVQACYEERSVFFSVENLGTIPLSGLQVMLYSDYDIIMTLKESLDPAQSSQYKLNFGNQEIPGVKRVRIIPLIGDGYMICTGAGIETALEKC